MSDPNSEPSQDQQDPEKNYGDPTKKPYLLQGDTPIGYLQRGVRQDDILLEDGLLERGHAGLLAGYSGIGKSGIAMQMGCCWSCGKEAFYLCPPRPLRIVMVQHEDSKNDLARMSQVVRSLGLDENLIRQNFWIETLRGVIGQEAINIMDELVKQRKADLLLINPLSAYHDGDITQNKDNIHFLYRQLGHLLDEAKIGSFAFHHKSKPAKDLHRNNHSKDDLFYQLQYDTLGGAMLTGFFRTIITVAPIGNSRVFRFNLAKRFEQSGWDSPHQMFKWHEDRSKRLWVPASVAETSDAQHSGKTLQDLYALVPVTGTIPRSTLELNATGSGGFTRKEFRGLIDEALDDSTPDSARLYRWSVYNPRGQPGISICRSPQPEDQTHRAVKAVLELERKHQKKAAVPASTESK